jgi:8-oxo-dGTP diphosphatase
MGKKSDREPGGRPLRAAGGLLERGDGPLLRIAVVHRLRYVHSDGTPGDWSLPKGKVKKGETLEEAALREVREETGRDALRSDSQSWEVAYVVQGRPKSVTYFRMACIEAVAAREPDVDEVDSVAWLTPVEALERLTYGSERHVVAEAYGLG